MAQSFPPFPTSTQAGQGSSGLRQPPPSDSDDSPPQTAEQVVAALRTAITGGDWDLGTALEKLAIAAHKLTRADGAAIAMLQGGLVICRARSGSIAPQLGTPLSVDSGISGECLRTGQSMRCDDTTKDLRVDAEVCGRLGLRSIAVVPLRGTHRVVGILEAFSSRAYSFPDRHLQLMSELADLAVAARSAHRQKTRATNPQARRAAVVLAGSGVLPSLRQVATSANRTLRHSMPVLGVLLAGVILVVGLGWLLLRGRSAGATPPPTTAHAVAKPSGEPEPLGSSAALVFNGAAASSSPPPTPKPSPSLLARASQKSDVSPARLVQKASQTEALPAAASPDSPRDTSSTDSPTTSAPTAQPPQPTAQGKTDDVAPTLASAALPEPSALGSVLSASPRIPSRSLPISQGVTDGVVIHRVQPVYPETARQARLEGRVVLQATVTEDGTVRDMKVVSGHPMLARAAQDAVAQWRYKPYRLNGKPVSMPTEIKLDFKLP